MKKDALKATTESFNFTAEDQDEGNIERDSEMKDTLKGSNRKLIAGDILRLKLSEQINRDGGENIYESRVYLSN